MIVIGAMFVTIYHIGTVEPPRIKSMGRTDRCHSDTLPIYKWFINPQFYLVSTHRILVN